MPQWVKVWDNWVVVFVVYSRLRTGCRWERASHQEPLWSSWTHEGWRPMAEQPQQQRLSESNYPCLLPRTKDVQKVQVSSCRLLSLSNCHRKRIALPLTFPCLLTILRVGSRQYGVNHKQESIKEAGRKIRLTVWAMVAVTVTYYSYLHDAGKWQQVMPRVAHW